jgi:hypothetical protein
MDLTLLLNQKIAALRDAAANADASTDATTLLSQYTESLVANTELGDWPDVNSKMLIDLAPAAGDSYEALILSHEPISYWRLGEATGSEAVDLGSFSQPGRYVFDSEPDDVSGWTPRDGVRPDNFAVRFGETGRLLDIAGELHGYQEAVGQHPFSCEFWVKAGAEALEANWFMVRLTGGSFSRFLWFRRHSMAFPQCHIERTSSDAGQSMSMGIPETIFDDQWHHLVLTRDSDGDLILWVDGEEAGSMTDVTGMTTSGTFSWGASEDGSQAFPGSLDELALYDYCLTPEQVAAHYAAGLA